jgi:hypothetical protein
MDQLASPQEKPRAVFVPDMPSRDLATQLEEQWIEIANLHERAKALAAKRKHREAMAQQVSDAAVNDRLVTRVKPQKRANALDK